jgi:hypothetical protein
MMRNGIVYQLVPLARLTVVTESSSSQQSWPTPASSDWMPNKVNPKSFLIKGNKVRKKTSVGDVGLNLAQTINTMHMWPTPTSSDATTGSIIGKNDQFKISPGGAFRKINQKGTDGSMGLGRLVKFFPTQRKTWPTPQNRDLKGESGGHQKGHDLPSKAGGSLNPNWVEWLMGFPTGWTELSPSETQSYRNSRKQSPKRSNKKRKQNE